MAKKEVTVRNMTRRINRAKDEANEKFHLNMRLFSVAEQVRVVTSEAKRYGVIKDEIVVPDKKAKAARAGGR